MRRMGVSALLALSLVGGAAAHRLDEYLQATLIGVTRDGIDVEIQLTPGVAVLPVVMAVIDRDREEALNLTGVEIHRQDAVGSRQLEHVGDEARRDRLARLRLAVLARIREERHHGRDPLGRGELRRLDHEEQLHQVPVDRLAPGLDEKDVGAADRLVVAAVRLTVRERAQLDFAELDADVIGDLPGELGMRAAGEDHQPLLRPALEPVSDLRPGHRAGCDLEPGQARELRCRLGRHIALC